MLEYEPLKGHEDTTIQLVSLNGEPVMVLGKLVDFKRKGLVPSEYIADWEIDQGRWGYMMYDPKNLVDIHTYTSTYTREIAEDSMRVTIQLLLLYS